MKQETIDRLFAHMPVLMTERLILRGLRRRDTDDMYAYACREDVTKYLLWRPHPDRGYTQDYLDYVESQYRTASYYEWAVTRKDTGRMIGTCGFNGFDLRNDISEIGYVLNPEFWGQGYATEAVQAVLRFGFIEVGLNRIEARHMIGNERSGAVMRRCGMQFEGTVRDAVLVQDTYRTVRLYSILRSEFVSERIHAAQADGIPSSK